MIGIDIEKIERFKSFNQKQLSRIYTKNELDYANKFSEPYSHLAGMWCVKEAFIKAIKDPTIPYKKIEILHNENKVPAINETKEIQKILEKINCNKIDISISHTIDTSCAVVEIL